MEDRLEVERAARAKAERRATKEREAEIGRLKEQRREARASELREAERRARENEAAQIGREAEAGTKTQKKREKEQEFEHRVTRSAEAEPPARRREPAQPERLPQTRVEAPTRTEEALEIELVAARPREVERPVRHRETSRGEHEASSHAAVPEPPRETRGALLRSERRQAWRSEAARLKSEEHRRLAEQEEARAVVRIEEQQRREKLRAHERAAAEAALEEMRTGRQEREAPPREVAEEDRRLGELLALRTQGRFIVDGNGRAVNLRGVTVIGLGSTAPVGNQTYRGALSLDDANLSALTGQWGVNLVRLPFQAGTPPDANMLAGLDDTADAITAAGAYVLLAVEPASTDDDTVQSWQLLAGRYRDEPGVLYEIVAPPLALPANWLHWAVRLAGIIRRQNPAALIFAGSGHGGIDATGLPLRFSTGEPVFNTVCTIDLSQHQHPGHHNRQLHALAESSPVFAVGWSETGPHFGRLSKDVADFFARHGIGWAASNWNAHPRLVADAAKHDFTPTDWGRVMQHALAEPARPLYQPFRGHFLAASGGRLQLPTPRR